MSKTVVTHTGCFYVVSFQSGGTVSAVTQAGHEVVLASLEGAGQVSFQAIAPECIVSDDTAVVLPHFHDAPVGLAARSGASAGQVAQMVDSALHEYAQAELATPEGNGDANVQWMELDGVHVPQGRLVSVSLRARSGNNPATQSYLAVWELGEDGTTWSYLGSSSNNPGQMMNRVATWEFGGEVRLSGRKVRLLAQAEPSGLWVVERELGCRVLTPLPEGDGSKVVYQGASHSYLPQIIFCYEEAQLRFAPAGHVGDASHLTEQEREAWNAKADASVLAAKVNSSTFNAHVANATLHVSAEEHAGLEELLARKDELLALLDAGQEAGGSESVLEGGEDEAPN